MFHRSFPLLLVVCCWVRLNAAVPFSIRPHVTGQVRPDIERQKKDLRATITDATKLLRTKVNAGPGVISSEGLPAGYHGDERQSYIPKTPIRSRNRNENVNVNKIELARKVVTTPRQAYLDISEEDADCKGEKKANERYSSSFLENSPTGARGLDVDDELNEVVGKESGPKATSSVHSGEDITLCWIETTTIKEDQSSKPPNRLVIREYTISFENSATIPDRYLECKRLRGELASNDPEIGKTALFEVVDENTRTSRVVNFTSVSHDGPILVWRHKRVKCGMGPVVTKNIVQWADDTDNPKKRVEIKVSPKMQRLVAAKPVEEEPCTTESTEEPTGAGSETVGNATESVEKEIASAGSTTQSSIDEEASDSSVPEGMVTHDILATEPTFGTVSSFPHELADVSIESDATTKEEEEEDVLEHGRTVGVANVTATETTTSQDIESSSESVFAKVTLPAIGTEEPAKGVDAIETTSEEGFEAAATVDLEEVGTELPISTNRDTATHGVGTTRTPGITSTRALESSSATDSAIVTEDVASERSKPTVTPEQTFEEISTLVSTSTGESVSSGHEKMTSTTMETAPSIVTSTEPSEEVATTEPSMVTATREADIAKSDEMTGTDYTMETSRPVVTTGEPREEFTVTESISGEVAAFETVGSGHVGSTKRPISSTVSETMIADETTEPSEDTGSVESSTTSGSITLHGSTKTRGAPEVKSYADDSEKSSEESNSATTEEPVGEVTGAKSTAWSEDETRVPSILDGSSGSGEQHARTTSRPMLVYTEDISKGGKIPSTSQKRGKKPVTSPRCEEGSTDPECAMPADQSSSRKVSTVSSESATLVPATEPAASDLWPTPIESSESPLGKAGEESEFATTVSKIGRFVPSRYGDDAFEGSTERRDIVSTKTVHTGNNTEGTDRERTKGAEWEATPTASLNIGAGTESVTVHTKIDAIGFEPETHLETKNATVVAEVDGATDATSSAEDTIEVTTTSEPDYLCDDSLEDCAYQAASEDCDEDSSGNCTHSANSSCEEGSGDCSTDESTEVHATETPALDKSASSLSAEVSIDTGKTKPSTVNGTELDVPSIPEIPAFAETSSPALEITESVHGTPSTPKVSDIASSGSPLSREVARVTSTPPLEIETPRVSSKGSTETQGIPLSAETKSTSVPPESPDETNVTTTFRAAATAETPRSTSPLTGRLTQGHKFSLTVKVLLEHLNEDKEAHNLVQVNKRVVFHESASEGGHRDLIDKMKSLNHSVNMEAVQALLNNTSLAKLAEHANVTFEDLPSNYRDESEVELEANVRLDSRDSTTDRSSESNFTETPATQASSHVTITPIRDSHQKPRDERVNAKTHASRNESSFEVVSEESPALDSRISAARERLQAKIRAIKESLPGIRKDVATGLRHVMSKLDDGERKRNDRHDGRAKGDRKTSLLDVLADPADERIHLRRRRAATDELGRWSNERIVEAGAGRKLRCFTELELHRISSRD